MIISTCQYNLHLTRNQHPPSLEPLLIAPPNHAHSLVYLGALHHVQVLSGDYLAMAAYVGNLDKRVYLCCLIRPKWLTSIT